MTDTYVCQFCQVEKYANQLQSPIPSAVVLPDEAASELPPPTNGLKRRQSDIPSQDQEQEQEQESKRQRISSPGKNSPPAAARDTSTTDPTHSTKQEKPAESRQDRRKSSIADEKQRSRRLFGALLGSLNPAASDRTSKRRAEIESRRKAELQRQDDERVEDKLRREERVKEQRRIVQERVEGENVCTTSALKSGVGWDDEALMDLGRCAYDMPICFIRRIFCRRVLSREL